MDKLYIKDPYKEFELISYIVKKEQFSDRLRLLQLPHTEITIELVMRSSEEVISFFTNNRNKYDMFLGCINLYGVCMRELNIDIDNNNVILSIRCDYYKYECSGNDPDWTLYKNREKVIDELLNISK